MSSFILLTNTDKIEVTEDEREKGQNGSFLSNIRHESNKHMIASLAKCVVYYEQGVSQILSSSKSTVFFGAFAALFDVSTLEVANGVSADEDRWCFIDGLNLKWKIFSDLLAPIMIMTLCGTIFILSKFVF